MSMGFEVSGDFSRLEKFLAKMKRGDLYRSLEAYAQQGVIALSLSTPIDSGTTASSWDYEISIKSGAVSITWTNSNINKGVPIAIILQYGHGTGTGGYVAGQDYINPAMKPIFQSIADNVWKEVQNS